MFSFFTAIFSRLEFRTISPLKINIKMNENISMAWIIHGKNAFNFYHLTVLMDTGSIGTNMYSLNTSNCGVIALAEFEVNSTYVNVDWAKVHRFALCAAFNSGELGTAEISCSDPTNVTIFNDLQGRATLIVCAWGYYIMHVIIYADWVNNNFGWAFGLAIIALVGDSLFVILCIIVGICLCCYDFKRKARCTSWKTSYERLSERI